ncbi:hypothetical protein ACFY19_28070 [Streptosporangium saharense]|uniref:hypothetical protein n=1 Tax=Streptosporangium saharense TaxID=1706840 RepID=UPI003680F149
MRNGMRLLLATATGAAVFASGTTTALASQSALTSARADARCAGSAEFSKVEWTDAFVPLKDNNEVTVTATLKNPFKKGTDGKWAKDQDNKAVRDITALGGEIVKPGATTGTKVDLDLPVTPVITADNEQSAALGEAKVTGKFTVTKDDKDGKWLLKLNPVRGTAQPCVEEIAVNPQLKLVGAAVTDPVVVTTNDDTKVAVKATVAGGATSVSAHLYSNDGNDSVDLNLDKGNSANSWYQDTWFDSDFTTGAWTLDVTVTRGNESIKYERADTFSVQLKKAKKKKVKSKISFDVNANKVRKGKTVRLYGAVYRGSSAYARKNVELYYRKKGSTKWVFFAVTKANSKGKYSKVVRPKVDAYWHAVAPGTSTTSGSTSASEFVDVR